VPKLRKEKTDEINKLIDEGYTNTEIHEKTGVSAGPIRKQRELREPKDESTEARTEIGSGLSTESLTKIGYMQGMYGAKTQDETIEKIFNDILALTQLKYRFDNDVKKTPGQVLSTVVKTEDNKDKSLKNIFGAKNSNFHQMLLFSAWEIDPAVNALYSLIPHEEHGTIFDFMQQAVIGSFKEIGYKIEYYWNEELDQKQSIITTPNGLKIKFPEGDITSVRAHR
jgi:hypothetical protein